MTRRRNGTTLVLALVVAVGPLSACSDQAPVVPPGESAASAAASAAAKKAEACGSAVGEIVTATQTYVDTYGPLPSGGTASPVPSPASSGGADSDFRQAVTDAQRNISDLGCDITQAQSELTTRLASVTARGPVANAVLLQTRAAITGRLPKEPVTRTISPADDLAVAVSEAPNGSTLTLTAGTYALKDSLALLTGVTLRGAGRDTTVISSPGADAVILVLTSERVALSKVAVAHTGTTPASVVLGGPNVSVAMTDVRLSGAKADPEGQGGAGVLLSARGTDSATVRGTTLELTRADVSGNGAAGIVLSGDHRVSIVSSNFASNGQCGICFLDSSTGSVQGSTFSGSGVGAVAVGSSRPTLIGNSFTGGEVGVQASGNAAPVLSKNTMSGMKRAAIILTGPVRGRIDGTVCRSVPFGIVLSPSSVPDLGANRCSVARSAS